MAALIAYSQGGMPHFNRGRPLAEVLKRRRKRHSRRTRGAFVSPLPPSLVGFCRPVSLMVPPWPGRQLSSPPQNVLYSLLAYLEQKGGTLSAAVTETAKILWKSYPATG